MPEIDGLVHRIHPCESLMTNREVLKIGDDTLVRIQSNETPHERPPRLLKEKLLIESKKRRTHRLHMKIIMAAE